MFSFPSRAVMVLAATSLLIFTTLISGWAEVSQDILDIEVASDIDSDTTWFSSDSPFWINDTITVVTGAVLTVESNSEVLFGGGAGLIIDGTVVLGDEDGRTNISCHDSDDIGSWQGFTVNSTGELYIEGISLIEAETAFDSSSNSVFVRNSTIASCNRTSYLSENSTLRFFNTTFDNTTLRFGDNRSRVETSSLLELEIVDIYGSPAGELDVSLVNYVGDTVYTYNTNATGIVPYFMIGGYSYTINGTNTTTGHHDVIMSDIPFTHFNNRSITATGGQPAVQTVRFSWPPEMTNIPERYFAYEDQLMVIPSRILDRNQVGSVQLNISSPNVTYDPIYEELNLVYEDEKVLKETVYLNLTDGYDERSYSIDVRVAPRNDPPVYQLPFTILYIREDTPYVFDVLIQDEDTPIEDLYVGSDDPDNISFDPVNRDFIFLYGDGTDPYFTINLTVGDGVSNITKEVDVFFTPVNYPPRIIRPLPDIIFDEDSHYLLDLSELVLNRDLGDVISYDIRVEDYELFTASLNGSMVNISSLKDMNGEGSLLVIVTDSFNATDSEYLNITILEVNDPPVLTSPHAEEVGPGRIWFNITYNDIDGDMPEYVYLVLDNTTYNMSLSSEGTLDPELGLYYHLYLDLDKDLYRFQFICSDGEFLASVDPLDLFIDPPERTLQLSGYNDLLNVTMIYVRNINIELEETDIPEGHSVQDEVGIVSFRLSGTFERINRIFVAVWIDDLNSDVLGQYCRVLSIVNGSASEVLGLDYDSGSGMLTFELGSTEVNKVIAVFSLLDPELDSDSDGYKNLIDEFPYDPDEWLDTDNDGLGNNADPDDDNDGYNDTIEEEAGTDPLSIFSSPVDTDNDGQIDNFDEDDDNDGMPDEWEVLYGLDPLNPNDADFDSDNDGRSNLEEYKDGTDPLDNLLNEGGQSDNLPFWLLIIVSSVLIVLIGSGILIFLMANRSRREEEVEEIEEDWFIREELEPEEAVDCPKCSNIYPLDLDDCPFCGEDNPYNGVVE